MLAILRPRGHHVDLTDDAIGRMRDTLAHRGPDGAGLWRGVPHAALAHRRLAVIAPGPEGHQPMVSPDGRYAISYNGELYNDRDVRAQLESRSVRFATDSDTETVLRALAEWGPDAASRLCGMYAFCFIDTHEHLALIGRDPLGVKPLYSMRRSVGGVAEIILASEPGAILSHPHVTPEPDLVTLSSYLSTIRPTLGSRTMFEGIETLRPGEWRAFDLASSSLAEVRHDIGSDLSRFAPRGGEPDEDHAARARDELSRSVGVHLRADVPMCALLSGGLDSSAICRIAIDTLRSLSTFCAGAETGNADDDLGVAHRTAAALGSEHTSARISRKLFCERWRDMVHAQGVPLSTPNEIAINEIARTLRAAGNVVALSGEGADELLAGYEPPLRLAAEFEAKRAQDPSLSPARFHVESNQWVPVAAKDQVCNDAFVRTIEGDRVLFEAYERDWAAINAHDDLGGDADPLAAHLRFQRRVNLENLLRRLDTATMLASVEGRTPFADARFAAWAEALPVSARLNRADPASWRTKTCLRDAFAQSLPDEVVARPKASFPLPFQEWIADHATTLRTSAFARELFTEAAIQTVAANPAQLWSFAWPMVNLALWGERWWGNTPSHSLRDLSQLEPATG